jgi:hypothetical protein
MIRILTAVLFVAGPAAGADIGPKPLDYPGLPTPLHDMKGIEVERAAEEVRLVLSMSKLEVDVVFDMVNHGAAAEFEEGFPVGPYKSMTEFSITMDGMAVPFKLVDRNSADPRADRAKESDPDYFGPRKETRREKAADFWYVWMAPFKAGGRHTHQVRYTVSLAHQHFYHETGYILHTGAAWKNPIGKAVVTLTFGKDIGIHHLRGVSPSDGVRFEKDRVVWTFEKFEPTKEHDIAIRYGLESWQDEIVQEKKEAPRSWYARRSLAATLREVPTYQGRKKFAPAELKEYLEVLGSLVGEVKVEDGKPVLPATDPERFNGPAGFVNPMEGMVRTRYYLLESNLAETFGGLFDEAMETARQHPDEPKAKEVLGAYREFLRSLLAGDLHLDYRPMAVNRKIAAERNIKITGRPGSKDGKVVPMDRLTDEQRKALEDRVAQADGLLGK